MRVLLSVCVFFPLPPLSFFFVTYQHGGGDVSLVEAAMTAACTAADEADLGGGKRPGDFFLL